MLREVTGDRMKKIIERESIVTRHVENVRRERTCRKYRSNIGETVRRNDGKWRGGKSNRVKNGEKIRYSCE